MRHTIIALPTAAAPQIEESYLLPPVIAESSEPLLAAIAAYADSHNPAIFDCSTLLRIDFNAASRLQSCLAPAAQRGIIIEFHQPNHLVLSLLKVIGLQELLHIEPRR